MPGNCAVALSFLQFLTLAGAPLRRYSCSLTTFHEDGLHAPMEADNLKDGLHKPTFHEDGLQAVGFGMSEDTHSRRMWRARQVPSASTGTAHASRHSKDLLANQEDSPAVQKTTGLPHMLFACIHFVEESGDFRLNARGVKICRGHVTLERSL